MTTFDKTRKRLDFEDEQPSEKRYKLSGRADNDDNWRTDKHRKAYFAKKYTCFYCNSSVIDNIQDHLNYQCSGIECWNCGETPRDVGSKGPKGNKCGNCFELRHTYCLQCRETTKGGNVLLNRNGLCQQCNKTNKEKESSSDDEDVDRRRTNKEKDTSSDDEDVDRSPSKRKERNSLSDEETQSVDKTDKCVESDAESGNDNETQYKAALQIIQAVTCIFNNKENTNDLKRMFEQIPDSVKLN